MGLFGKKKKAEEIIEIPKEIIPAIAEKIEQDVRDMPSEFEPMEEPSPLPSPDYNRDIEDEKIALAEKNLIVHNENKGMRKLITLYKKDYRRLAEIERQFCYGITEITDKNFKKKYVELLNERDILLDEMDDIKEVIVDVNNIMTQEQFDKIKEEAINDWINIREYKPFTIKEPKNFTRLI